MAPFVSERVTVESETLLADFHQSDHSTVSAHITIAGVGRKVQVTKDSTTVIERFDGIVSPRPELIRQGRN